MVVVLVVVMVDRNSHSGRLSHNETCLILFNPTFPSVLRSFPTIILPVMDGSPLDDIFKECPRYEKVIVAIALV